MTSPAAQPEEQLRVTALHAFERGARDGIVLGLVVPAAGAVIDYIWRKIRG